MKKDALFRGCTRPPMIFGVPYMPFLVGAGVPLLLAMYVSLYILLTIPFVIVMMRLIAKKDELIFRLIGLNLVFRFLPRNSSIYGSSWVFGPSRYRKDAHRLGGY
ncbi:type IV secretion system protein VirB3 [Ottowia sp.]|uniref:type IV secretion system protein VirB3 n=1 Tax=Ottowia sp. TaxID=1898956 RepID=UPI003A8453E6